MRVYVRSFVSSYLVFFLSINCKFLVNLGTYSYARVRVTRYQWQYRGGIWFNGSQLEFAFSRFSGNRTAIALSLVTHTNTVVFPSLQPLYLTLYIHVTNYNSSFRRFSTIPSLKLLILVTCFNCRVMF